MDDDGATRKALLELVGENDLARTSSASPSPVAQQPTVPRKTHENKLADYNKLDVGIVQHGGDKMNDASNPTPNLGIRNEVPPLQSNVELLSQLMYNPVDNNMVVHRSNEADQLKNETGIIDETKKLQGQHVSTPQVQQQQQHYYEDLLILEKDSAGGNVDVTDGGQYYNNANSYEMPVPTAPTLEAIYGTSFPHTDYN